MKMKTYGYFRSSIGRLWTSGCCSLANSPAVSTKWSALCTDEQQQLMRFRFLLFELHGWPRFIYTSHPYIHSNNTEYLFRAIQKGVCARARFSTDRMAYIRWGTLVHIESEIESEHVLIGPLPFFSFASTRMCTIISSAFIRMKKKRIAEKCFAFLSLVDFPLVLFSSTFSTVSAIRRPLVSRSLRSRFYFIISPS